MKEHETFNVLHCVLVVRVVELLGGTGQRILCLCCECVVKQRRRNTEQQKSEAECE